MQHDVDAGLGGVGTAALEVEERRDTLQLLLQRPGRHRATGPGSGLGNIHARLIRSQGLGFTPGRGAVLALEVVARFANQFFFGDRCLVRIGFDEHGTPS